MKTIQVRGARTHNLKNIDLDFPRDKLIVVTGLSGSGKSSLAFDTLYAEGQRRYVESLSAYARQFLSMMQKPDVDHIEGLSPAISIEQKATSHNPRSTVGTITEIYDYLRLLYARVGQPYCPTHHTLLEAQTISQMVDAVLSMGDEKRMMILAPIMQARKGEHLQLLQSLKIQGFVRARIDGKVVELDEAPKLNLKVKHTIEVVIDRFKIRADMGLRLAESFETAIRLANGLAIVADMDNPDAKESLFSSRFACLQCGYSLSELEPRLFSFNNPAGACSECDGLGVKQFFDPTKAIQNPELSLSAGAIRGWDKRNVHCFNVLTSLSKHYDFDINTSFQHLDSNIKDKILYGSGKEKIAFMYTNTNGRCVKRTHTFEGIMPNLERRYRETESQAIREDLARYLAIDRCPSCEGGRLKLEARHVFITEKSLPQITALPIHETTAFFQKLKLPGKRGEIAARILKELNDRLGFLVSVGLDYLTLNRSADTLSGGEAQRIRLASQIGSGLVGVMYILDEPSIGLHQRDNDRLLKMLMYLRDLGNTVIVVEHDEDAIRNADHIIDMGPGAGIHGGSVVAEGSLKQILACENSLTGQYLSGKLKIEVPEKRVSPNHKRMLRLTGATCNNLKNVDVEIPIGLMTCVTGVSGSGKSSLINDTLMPIAARELNGAFQVKPGHYDQIVGMGHFDKMVNIDQSPIGRTPRSNPATYTGLFTIIRELFAGTQEARSRGYTVGRFSFNVKGGRCEACEGDGLIKVEMHFLADVYVQCDLCQGKRYNRETLDVRYKGKNIHEVLSMNVEEAYQFFEFIPKAAKRLQTLIEVGLSYIGLGQNATTLSGGEAQRVKLAKELARRDTGNTLYILDEPTTGLHFHDVRQLLEVLHRLRDHGNTVIVIEHNLDVIKTADWVIDLGPEGGEKGGYVLAKGTPEEIIRHKNSYTGQFLKAFLEK